MIVKASIRNILLLAGAIALGSATARAQLSPIPPPPPNPNAPLPLPLSQNPVPEPTTLGDFVKDKAAAIRLGKAFFWDMQVGSDGVVACASCHFHAFADNRLKNQLNPGILHGASTFEAGGPNSTLTAGNFPFHRFEDPTNRGSAIEFDTDDVVSSQGVFNTTFNDIVPGSAVDNCTQIPDPIWTVGGTKVRRVEPRNTPSAINAIFNFRNFHDGRAAFFFNGANPVGPRDPDARVFQVQALGDVAPIAVLIDNGSLASQAVGPPGSPFEMSCGGRTFPKIGKKMLSLQPLAKQMVHPTDSLLGTIRHASGTGLSQTYAQMIQAAFHETWWDSNKVITFPGGVPTVSDPTAAPLTTNEFTVTEANFSLFWGLAIQLYEATLVSDQTAFDRFSAGDGTALTPEQQEGLDIFLNQGACIACHGGSLFSNATIPQIGLLPAQEFEGLIENMHMALGLELSALHFVRPPVGVPPVEILTFDPRGVTIELVPPGGMCGDPAAFSGMVPGTPGSCDPVAPAATILPATGNVPLAPEALALAVFEVGAACAQTLAVELESVALGDWVLCVGGVQRGLIPVVSVGAASAGGLLFESPPAPPFPAVQPLDFDPRGALIQIVAGGACSDPVAFETVFPGAPAPPCDPLVPVDLARVFSAAVEVPLTNLVPLGPFPLATASFDVAADCSATFAVELLGVPAGTYGICVDGLLQGSQMVVAEAFYDQGFYNIGIRPTMEDLGLGGEAMGPISFARRLQLGLPVPELNGIQPPPPITALSRVTADGAFKTPILRNVALTAPYMHNGGMLTLAHVVEFYARGADFFEANINDLDPDVAGIGHIRNDAGRRAAVAAFLESLTDDRVRFKKAPFDSPQLFVPNGHPGTSSLVIDDSTGKARDVLMELPAVGADGACIGIDGTRETTPRPCPEATATVEADVAVQQSAPTTKFGTSTQLLADADTPKRTFIRVRLDGIGGRTVTNAILRLQVANTSTAPSNSGGRIRVISNCSWDEAMMTWNTQPALDGALLDAEGPVAVNLIVDLDVTAAMLHDGVVCFAIDSLSSDAVTYNSREAATGKPQILLTLAGSCDCATAPAPACGDGKVNTLTEECDGASDGACPGRCQADCLCAPPVCGDGAINRAGEVCDGAAVGACPFGCTASCTCAVAPVLPPVGTVLADVHVSSDTPSTNLGTKTQISADAGPTVKRTFIRVQVSNVGGRTVTQALLNLKVGSTSNAQSVTGGRIRRITNCGWGETTTNFNNQPALDGAVIQTLGAVAMNQNVSFNVTSGIPGDGTFCFAIDSASTDGVDYNSLQASTGKPTLSITVAP